MTTSKRDFTYSFIVNLFPADLLGGCHPSKPLGPSREQGEPPPCPCGPCKPFGVIVASMILCKGAMQPALNSWMANAAVL